MAPKRSPTGAEHEVEQTLRKTAQTLDKTSGKTCSLHQHQDQPRSEEEKDIKPCSERGILIPNESIRGCVVEIVSRCFHCGAPESLPGHDKMALVNPE